MLDEITNIAGLFGSSTLGAVLTFLVFWRKITGKEVQDFMKSLKEEIEEIKIDNKIMRLEVDSYKDLLIQSGKGSEVIAIQKNLIKLKKELQKTK